MLVSLGLLQYGSRALIDQKSDQGVIGIALRAGIPGAIFAGFALFAKKIPVWVWGLALAAGAEIGVNGGRMLAKQLPAPAEPPLDFSKLFGGDESPSISSSSQAPAISQSATQDLGAIVDDLVSESELEAPNSPTELAQLQAALIAV